MTQPIHPYRLRQTFDRRLWVFHLLALVLVSALFLRMVDLQWIRHQGLHLQAENNRLNVVPILPTRGTIVDRNGNALADNAISYQLLMIPERVQDMEHTLAILHDHMAWSEAKLQRIRKRIRHSRKDRPILLDERLKWNQVAWLLARLHHYPGLNVHAATHRVYPHGALTAHLIGYLAKVQESDLKKGFLADEYVGRSGLEKQFESRLHGIPGNQQEEVDAHGRKVAVLQVQPPKMGETIHLALDVRLQQVAAQAMGDRTGSVVVMDVQSGEVLVLLSTPGYNTNAFTGGISQRQWSSWLHDPRKPLLNRSIQAAYPPGSTWKMVSAMAGMRVHAPLIDRKVRCQGALQLPDRKLRCWKRSGHGMVDLHDALMHSCDIYFYQLGDQIGMAPLIKEARLWGFGEKTGIQLSPEARGHLPRADAHVFHGRRRAWFRGEIMITAIGQGLVTVTPIQVARFAAALANGGNILQPKLLRGKEPRIVQRVEIPHSDLQRIRQAMFDVANTPGGTAYAYLHRTRYPIAGKTGTAQVVQMSQKQERYSDKDVKKEHRDHAWFMGYAPYRNPRIAFAILVEHGGHGSSGAAPVAAAIVNAWHDKDHSFSSEQSQSAP